MDGRHLFHEVNYWAATVLQMRSAMLVKRLDPQALGAPSQQCPHRRKNVQTCPNCCPLSVCRECTWGSVAIFAVFYIIKRKTNKTTFGEFKPSFLKQQKLLGEAHCQQLSGKSSLWAAGAFASAAHLFLVVHS